MKLNAKQLREIDEKEIADKLKSIKRLSIYFILENIYDTYNIGGLFRLADALAIEKMYICGETEIPPNSRIKKASIGTYKVVPWIYKKSVKEAIEELRSNYSSSEGAKRLSREDSSRQARTIKVIAVEQHKTSIPYTKANYSFPIALIFGNETSGITEETLKLADQIVEIPMWGINKSLNVIVSAAIVSYWIVSS
ncbi:hypothetical protein COY13_00410 [Candidatus Roizmanbacteria bacterium CG_4_10_14_0_2_um_filter_36_35]|uniref:tRNA/rRNA methyltransferase SpoU type domain-containing protein n=3 Tax=Candidatus Roizmaniibacteriota TaxID=1752723 RepID=A0A2M7BWL6_9BACT|nr:MAG: hypothetical protein COV86_02520 [Candidatus Roizmanbacteria bacterium CG11_big_fil_rev_8_21_14_0_20_35_14]PIV10925.1 MAG: hypothetical protein COS50_02945 [Candidatus Roizmanbacteria bacterium CG03_land_8_20_14_0_80_35_26]PIZ68814.1 MAG: hypothetical protein COY13_00410 [Candidatus Roizmanbacteria bacterium CG_4_10_14_0_2_um_filter_36_35]PJC79853.1 MAG: hypothetical protein CO008_03820 [Candidatus Roizmanbacteria bacterium CG_4_8_14_3_um_filter_36_12]